MMLHCTNCMCVCVCDTHIFRTPVLFVYVHGMDAARSPNTTQSTLPSPPCPYSLSSHHHHHCARTVIVVPYYIICYVLWAVRELFAWDLKMCAMRQSRRDMTLLYQQHPDHPMALRLLLLPHFSVVSLVLLVPWNAIHTFVLYCGTLWLYNTCRPSHYCQPTK